MTQNAFANPDFRRCADFHGHVCPGLAIGYMATKAGLAQIGQNRSEDEELVAVVETDACGVDAVQVLAGCTFGKGNLIHKDHGKSVFTFFGRKSGKGIRVAVKPNAIKPNKKHMALMAKMRAETATETEKAEFKRLHQARCREVLESAPEALFDIRPATVSLPAKARVMASELCDACGEPTMGSKIVEKYEKKLCRECAASQ
jgi:formylmethanofuran dehydrogenase subunit E